MRACFGRDNRLIAATTRWQSINYRIQTMASGRRKKTRWKKTKIFRIHPIVLSRRDIIGIFSNVIVTYSTLRQSGQDTICGIHNIIGRRYKRFYEIDRITTFRLGGVIWAARKVYIGVFEIHPYSNLAWIMDNGLCLTGPCVLFLNSYFVFLVKNKIMTNILRRYCQIL